MTSVERAFTKLGYPVVLNENPRSLRWRRDVGYSINTGHTEEGDEAFLVDLEPNVELLPLDTQPKEEAMLVLLRYNDEPDPRQRNIAKFLLGHDERQLFIAAVPSNTKTVLEAKDNLKPRYVHSVETRTGVKKKNKNKHRNKARIRQGDFFFIPMDNPADIDVSAIKRNQPLRRGGRGNAHMLEEVVEVGGQGGYERNGVFITGKQYESLGKMEKIGYRQTTRNGTLYARGKVRHPEHKTIKLNGWHLVIPNTESDARNFRGQRTLGRLAYTD